VDPEVLFAIHERSFRSHIEAIWGWDEPWQRQRFAEEIGASETRAVRVDGRILGYIQVAEEPERIFLRNINIEAGARGCGIGSELIRDLKARAAHSNLPVALGVFRTNPRAVSFYERLGFVRTGRTETHVAMEWRSRSDERN